MEVSEQSQGLSASKLSSPGSPKENKKNSSLTIIAAAFVAAVILGVGLFIYYNSQFSSNSQNSANQSVAAPETRLEKEEVRIGLVAGLGSGVAENFYPFYDLDQPGHMVTAQYLEGLVNLGPDFKIQPLLAKSWRNVDDNTWIFNLRQGVTFSNGASFSATDVKFTFDVINQNATSWASAQYLQTIKEVKVVDPYTIEIVTSKPDRSLLYKLSYLFILSSKTFKPTDVTTATIGTGPYLLTSGKRDTSGVLTRNETYWGERAKVKKVTYKVVSDDTERTNALLNKELDFIEYVPGDSLAQLKTNPNYQVVVNPDLYVWYLGFDTQRDKTPYVNTDTNPFKNLKVRQAIYSAINIDELIQNTYKGFAEAETQLVTKYIFGFNPDIKRYPYDPVKAKKLLAEAGYPNGFKVNIDVGHPRIGEYAKEVVRQLAKIGIQAEVKVRRKGVTSAEDAAKYKAGDTSMFMGSWGAEDADAQSGLAAILHGVTEDNKYGSYNFGHFKDAVVDGLIEQAAAETNQQKRLSLMQQAMKTAIVDDVAIVPLNVDGVGFAFTKDISWKPRADNAERAYEFAGKAVQ
ncbi:MAG: ABC transporter substrate-binding protein [Patescibacteria group bacterium]|nr:ABC transporter substrate-binding protein [Patescibacteria group bacterium]